MPAPSFADMYKNPKTRSRQRPPTDDLGLAEVRDISILDVTAPPADSPDVANAIAAYNADNGAFDFIIALFQTRQALLKARGKLATQRKRAFDGVLNKHHTVSGGIVYHDAALDHHASQICDDSPCALCCAVEMRDIWRILMDAGSKYVAPKSAPPTKVDIF